MTTSSPAFTEQFEGKQKMKVDFVSKVSSIASICGALRFFWSFLLEKYSYRKIYGSLILT